VEKEGVPKESETIAVKRAIRLSEKLRKARAGFAENKAWWSNAAVEFISVSALVVLNLILVIPFIDTPAPAIPYSGPIIPLLAKILELVGLSLPYAFQALNILFFLLFPVTFYIFVKYLTDRKLIALTATLFASLPFYPFSQIRANATFLGGDAPHIAALAVTPLALYGLIAFLKNGGIKHFIIASIFSSIDVLISPFGFLTFAIFAGIAGFSEMLLGSGRLKFFRLISTFFVSASLSAFWYNPAFTYWIITGPMGGDFRFMITKLFPISFFVLPVLGSFGYLLFDRKPNLQPIFQASFFTIAFSLIALAGGGIFPSHPSRYASELGISIAFIFGVILVKLIDYVRFLPAGKLSFVGFSNIKSNLVADFAVVSLFVLLISVIIAGRERLMSDNRLVLGIWSGVAKGEIWVAKDRFGGFSRTLGYAITGGSIIGLTFVSRYRKSQ